MHMRWTIGLVMLAACGAKDAADKYAEKSKQIEAQLMLKNIEKAAKRGYAEDAQFPVGSAPLTPAPPCCAAPDHKCPIGDEWRASPVWNALEIQPFEASRFQYSYTSDGKTVTATAVGDLDCDGTTITFTLRGDSPNGNPTFTLEEPRNAD